MKSLITSLIVSTLFLAGCEYSAENDSNLDSSIKANRGAMLTKADTSKAKKKTKRKNKSFDSQVAIKTVTPIELSKESKFDGVFQDTLENDVDIATKDSTFTLGPIKGAKPNEFSGRFQDGSETSSNVSKSDLKLQDRIWDIESQLYDQLEDQITLGNISERAANQISDMLSVMTDQLLADLLNDMDVMMDISNWSVGVDIYDALHAASIVLSIFGSHDPMEDVIADFHQLQLDIIREAEEHNAAPEDNGDGGDDDASGNDDQDAPAEDTSEDNSMPGAVDDKIIAVEIPTGDGGDHGGLGGLGKPRSGGGSNEPSGDGIVNFNDMLWELEAIRSLNNYGYSSPEILDFLNANRLLNN